MEKVESVHLITDFKSLEDEALTLLGLDIDDALENSKIYGSDIKRKTKITQSAVAIVVLLVVIGTATFLTIESRKDSTVSPKALRTFEAKAITPKPIAAVQTPVAPAVETPASPVVAPFVYPSFETGNASLCTFPTEVPDENGIMIGTSMHVVTFNPSQSGETYQEGSLPAVKYMIDPTYSAGHYIVFGSNNFPSGTYAKQSPSGLTFCDGSNVMKATADGSRYSISFEGK